MFHYMSSREKLGEKPKKFEEEHSGCVVNDQEIVIGVENFSCYVMVVSQKGWVVQDPGTHENHTLVTNVQPIVPLTQGWTLVLVDVYLLSPHEFYARLTDGNNKEYKNVTPMTCVNMGIRGGKSRSN
jgi:hypothetical protein